MKRQLAAAFVSQHQTAAKAQASLRTPKSPLFSEQIRRYHVKRLEMLGYKVELTEKKAA